MRVALVTHYYPAHRGGIELVAAEIARRLAAHHGAEVVWHASDCDPAPQIKGVRCVAGASWNAAERRLGFPYPLWSPAALLRLARDVRAADVVHLHDCLYLPNLAACAAARLAGRPIVVTQHVGMVPYRNPLLRALLALAYRVLGRTVLRTASAVVFVSQAVQDYFEGFVGFRSRPLLIPNGVDGRIFHPVDPSTRDALRARLGIAHTTPLLLFVGRFVEKKGLPLLQRIAAALPRARWLFAGWGPLDPQRWGLETVTVLRGLESAQLAPLYQAADLLVLPSIGEGFPLVVQEAMACGTPALVSEQTAAGFPAASREVLLWEPLDSRDAAARWSSRIESLLTGPELLAELRPRVAAFATEHWSWDRCARDYDALLRQASGIGGASELQSSSLPR